MLTFFIILWSIVGLFVLRLILFKGPLGANVEEPPKGIIDKFDLFNLDLKRTTNYGHFGKSDMPWEKTDLWT